MTLFDLSTVAGIEAACMAKFPQARIPAAFEEPHAYFEADGVTYARYGRFIQIGDRSFRIDGYKMAKHLFRRLTVASA